MTNIHDMISDDDWDFGDVESNPVLRDAINAAPVEEE